MERGSCGTASAAAAGRASSTCCSCSENLSTSLPKKRFPFPPAMRSVGRHEQREFAAGRAVLAQSGCLACHKIVGAATQVPARTSLISASASPHVNRARPALTAAALEREAPRGAETDRLSRSRRDIPEISHGSKVGASATGPARHTPEPRRPRTWHPSIGKDGLVRHAGTCCTMRADDRAAGITRDYRRCRIGLLPEAGCGDETL